MSTISRGRRIGRVAGATTAALGFAAAAAILAAPANAVVGSVTATPGAGGKHGTTCTSTLVATAPTGRTVNFFENNQFIGNSVSSNGRATLEWTPSATGLRVIKAHDNQTPVRETQATVGRGINTGSACFVL